MSALRKRSQRERVADEVLKLLAAARELKCQLEEAKTEAVKERERREGLDAFCTAERRRHNDEVADLKKSHESMQRVLGGRHATVNELRSEVTTLRQLVTQMALERYLKAAS